MAKKPRENHQSFEKTLFLAADKLRKNMDAAESARADHDTALEELIEALKSDIHYAENTINFDDDKLKLLGWAGKKTKTPLTRQGLGISRLESPRRRRQSGRL